MKTNVINSQFAIECFEGSLEIFGKNNHNVVFILRGTSAGDLIRSCPNFCKNLITTNEIGDGIGHQRNVLIFEYRLQGELRNPRKLLKSVRNKLVQAGFRNQREEDKEYNEKYTMPDREEHRMFEDGDEDRPPLMQVCFT